jgi:hypothetical protein
MKDELLIKERLQKGKQAREKVENHFLHLSSLQINWKSSGNSWSIAECLDHLFISHLLYFEVLKEIIDGTYRMTWWERNSPLTSFFGSALKDQLQENVKRKMTAPKKLKPSSSDKPADFVRTYISNLENFLDLIARCKNVDLDNTIITSPLINMVTYTLRDSFEFLINHEHRHINQAVRVKENKDFPKA